MPEQMTEIMHSNNCCISTYMSLQLIHRSHVEDKNSILVRARGRMTDVPYKHHKKSESSIMLTFEDSSTITVYWPII